MAAVIPPHGYVPGVPPFPGATFKYLAANVIHLDNGQTLFPAYVVKRFDGVKVAFLGIALEATPTIVVPSGVAGLAFQPEVDTINRLVKVLKDTEGIKAFVVILHDGAGPASSPDTCNLSDPFFADVVKKVDPEVENVLESPVTRTTPTTAGVAAKRMATG